MKGNLTLKQVEKAKSKRLEAYTYLYFDSHKSQVKLWNIKQHQQQHHRLFVYGNVDFSNPPKITKRKRR